MPVVGIDVVEVSPPHDHADITAALANRVVLEALSAIARRRLDDREGTRWDPSRPLLDRPRHTPTTKETTREQRHRATPSARHRAPRPEVAGAAGAEGRRGQRRGAHGAAGLHRRGAGRDPVDADGNQLIDFGSGIAVTSVGNGNPRVVKAVQDQIARLTHTCVMVTPYEPYVEVCEKLQCPHTGDHKRSALFNSGAEAVENAVKIARHFTGRQAIVAFDHAYHGRTNLTLGMTEEHALQGPLRALRGELYRAPMAYPYRWPGGERPARVTL